MNGNTRSALYRVLIGKGADITWNFEKFLVSGQGAVLERFSPSTTPLDPTVITAIEKALP